MELRKFIDDQKIIQGITSNNYSISTTIVSNKMFIAYGEPFYTNPANEGLNGINIGRTRIFSFDLITKSISLIDTILGENEGDKSGSCAKLLYTSGKSLYLGIGEPNFNEESGRIRIFKYDDQNNFDELEFYEGDAGGFLGFSLDMVENNGTVSIISGAPGNANNITGYVKIINLNTNNDTFEEIQELDGDNNGDKFGFSVKGVVYNGNFFMTIGAPNNDNNTGIVKSYTFNDDDNEYQIVADASIEGKEEGSYYGYDIDLLYDEDNENLLMAVTAPYLYDLDDEDNVIEKNYNDQTIVYKYTNNNWDQYGFTIFYSSGFVSLNKNLNNYYLVTSPPRQNENFINYVNNRPASLNINSIFNQFTNVFEYDANINYWNLVDINRSTGTYSGVKHSCEINPINNDFILLLSEPNNTGKLINGRLRLMSLISNYFFNTFIQSLIINNTNLDTETAVKMYNSYNLFSKEKLVSLSKLFSLI